MQPMLAKATTDRDKVATFLGPEWGFQQKYDGERNLFVADGRGGVTVYNRNGDVTFGPRDLVAALGTVPFPVTLDCEVIAGEAVAFDLPEMPGVIVPAMPLRDRLTALDRITGALKLPLVVARTAYTRSEKQAMMDDVIAGNGEGWVAKRLLSAYVEGEAGRDTRAWRKLKRYKDIDCVVMYLGDEKINMGLGLYRDGQLVPVGECTRLAGTGMDAVPGDVVKVTCLYATDDDRLYQPTRPIVRHDKIREACLWEQLDEIRTNKRLLLV